MTSKLNSFSPNFNQDIHFVVFRCRYCCVYLCCPRISDLQIIGKRNVGALEFQIVAGILIGAKTEMRPSGSFLSTPVPRWQKRRHVVCRMWSYDRVMWTSMYENTTCWKLSTAVVILLWSGCESCITEHCSRLPPDKLILSEHSRNSLLFTLLGLCASGLHSDGHHAADCGPSSLSNSCSHFYFSLY